MSDVLLSIGAVRPMRRSQPRCPYAGRHIIDNQALQLLSGQAGSGLLLAFTIVAAT